MEETTIERLARLLRQDAEDHARMACGASWEYQTILQTALLDAAEMLFKLKVKDDRIAVLEAFVRAYDAWCGTPFEFEAEIDDDLYHLMTSARELVGKIGTP